MRFLLLIPSVAKTGIEAAVQARQHPRMDYYVLRDLLQSRGHEADIVDYAVLDGERRADVRALCRVDKDAALARLGFHLSQGYDAVYTNGENVSIPLSLYFRTRRTRPGHVTIGHKPSTGKKRFFFKSLGVMQQIDTMFLYSALQQKIAVESLGIRKESVPVISFHADTEFYRPMEGVSENARQIGSAGLEWRDYPTLVRAVSEIGDVTVRLAAASPWSKHTNETEKLPLPDYITARRYAYDELRELYAQSAIVAVPLYDNDFQAGVTTLLEAMAMGKPTVTTRTQGQTDVVQSGETGLYVPPGDTAAMRDALKSLLENRELRAEIGRKARTWVEKYATIEQWAERIAERLVISVNRVK